MNKEKKIDIVRVEKYFIEETALKPNENGTWTFRPVKAPKGFDKNILFSAEV